MQKTSRKRWTKNLATSRTRSKSAPLHPDNTWACGCKYFVQVLASTRPFLFHAKYLKIMKTDEIIKGVVVAAIRRHSMEMENWVHTFLWDFSSSGIKAELLLHCPIAPGELPILYSYLDSENWTLVTTRRIFGSCEGKVGFVCAQDIIESKIGNFKGHGLQKVEQMQIRTQSSEPLLCPFETGKASMGTIYAVRTLRQIIEPQN